MFINFGPFLGYRALKGIKERCTLSTEIAWLSRQRNETRSFLQVYLVIHGSAVAIKEGGARV